MEMIHDYAGVGWRNCITNVSKHNNLFLSDCFILRKPAIKGDWWILLHTEILMIVHKANNAPVTGIIINHDYLDTQM